MPISDNVSAVNAVLKFLYKAGVPHATYNKQALLNKLKVNADFTGEKKVLAIQIANPQGFGSSFDRAYANASSAESYKRWQLFRVQHYGFARVDGEVMRTAVDPGALVNVWKNRTQSVVQGMHNSVGRLIYGAGTGRIGTVGVTITAASAPTSITLGTAADIANFEVGMYVQIYDTYGGGGGAVPQGAGDSFSAFHVNLTDGTKGTEAAFTAAPSTYTRKVTAVQRDLGGTVTITLDAAIATGAGQDIKAGAIIVRDGDGIVVDGAATSYDTNAKAPSGIEQWIAGSNLGTAPAGNTLFGLDRSSDKLRLSGQVLNGAGLNMVEALQTLEANILFQGIGYPDAIVVNPVDFGNLKKSALSDVLRLPAQDPKQNLNFQDLIFMGQNGPIPFVQDPFCPRNKAYMLKMDTWGIHCAPGGMFQLVDWDGVNYLRLTNADTYEARFASYYQIGCDNPGPNGYIYGWGT
jgi:hypothetical protein